MLFRRNPLAPVKCQIVSVHVLHAGRRPGKPFMMKFLEVEVTMERVELDDAGEIVAVCRRMTRTELFRSNHE